jgi:hypothetical protein
MPAYFLILIIRKKIVLFDIVGVHLCMHSLGADTQACPNEELEKIGE